MTEFGLIQILEHWPVKGGKRLCKVLCFCGKEFIIRKDSVDRGNTKSCGCRKRKVLVENGELSGFHFHSGKRKWKTGHSPTYTSWNGMKNRCTNSKTKHYHRYGGRGIKICERWINSFENFLEDMGEKPGRGYSIDRIDNEGNYEPINCQWITIAENARKQHADKKLVIAK